MKYNKTFLCDAYAYDMYNYDIKYSVEHLIIKYINFLLAFRKRNVWKIGAPFGTSARQVKTLARRMCTFKK